MAAAGSAAAGGAAAQHCPEVSISLVTRDRPLFLEHALELIDAQDYPADCFEVVLVDSSDPPVEPLLGSWPVCSRLGARLRYFHYGHAASIGEKRNFAVKQSRGSIVMQWDDDDYYGPSRMRLQAMPILEGRARCSALLFGLWYFLDQDEFWRGPPAELGHGLSGGHPGTFAFDRSLWSQTDPRLQYPHTNFADPDDFQSAAADILGARTVEVGEEVDFVYVRHRRAAASCEGELRLGVEECVLGIYFEVLGVRGFGQQVPPPSFLPRRTREVWARARASEPLPATLAASPLPGGNDGARFDRHVADAFRLLRRHLGRYSDGELRRWRRGEALTDGTRKRHEIREVFLGDVIPALLTRVASMPARFDAGVLADAVLVCHRLGHDGGQGGVPLRAISSSLLPRLPELKAEDAARLEGPLRALAGGKGVVEETWEIVD